MKRKKKSVVFRFAIDGDEIKVRKQQARPATAHKDKSKYSRKSKYRGDHPEQSGGPFVFGLAA